MYGNLFIFYAPIAPVTIRSSRWGFSEGGGGALQISLQTLLEKYALRVPDRFFPPHDL
jgi:hypothetical protein